MCKLFLVQVLLSLYFNSNIPMEFVPQPRSFSLNIFVIANCRLQAEFVKDVVPQDMTYMFVVGHRDEGGRMKRFPVASAFPMPPEDDAQAPEASISSSSFSSSSSSSPSTRSSAAGANSSSSKLSTLEKEYARLTTTALVSLGKLMPPLPVKH